jgi:acyl-CoA reductase-like NAD-dependent aldehyde dehydrogenase
MSRKAELYVDGTWIGEDRESRPVVNPYTGERIGEQVLATPEDVEKALQSAWAARKDIAEIPAFERAKILKTASSNLEAEKERFARLISMELGKPLKNTRDEVARAIETLEISGEEAKRLNGESIYGDASPRGKDALAVTFRVPVGVVAAITPFNAPLNLICHKIGPAFAGGNSVILKPAPQTPLIAAELLKLLLRSGFPEKGVQMVLGGAETGQQIVKDARVHVVSFTGGVAGGRKVCEAAGMKKVLLELGGNAATIVHDDADLQEAARLCAKTGFSNSGQSCISVQRIYVHQAVAESFTRYLRQEVEQLKVGNPLDPDTDVGCMVHEEAAVRVMRWIEEARESGAELVLGGKRSGATVWPTVLFNPPRHAKVVCEEVFGPVVCVIPYQTLEEAFAETNNSPYGLQAGIFTKNLEVAYRAARQLEVGGVVINGTSNFRLDHWPYGGVKHSGIGREGPRYAIEEMTESKMIVFRMPTTQ